jgi:hypothetical protein
MYGGQGLRNTHSISLQDTTPAPKNEKFQNQGVRPHPAIRVALSERRVPTNSTEIVPFCTDFPVFFGCVELVSSSVWGRVTCEYPLSVVNCFQ